MLVWDWLAGVWEKQLEKPRGGARQVGIVTGLSRIPA